MIFFKHYLFQNQIPIAWYVWFILSKQHWTVNLTQQFHYRCSSVHIENQPLGSIYGNIGEERNFWWPVNAVEQMARLVQYKT